MIKLVTRSAQLFDSPQVERQSTPEELLQWLEDTEVVQVDTETIRDKIATIQFGNFDTQYVVDVFTIDPQIFKSFLEGPKLKILQNAKFDYKQFKNIGINLTNFYDTFIAECMITNGIIGRRLRLDYIVEKYAGAKLLKEDRGKINYMGLAEEVVLYAANDVKYLEIVMNKQMPLIEAERMQNQLAVEHTMVKVFGDIEYYGINFDVDAWTKNTNKNIERLKQESQRLDEILKDTPGMEKYFKRGVQLDLFGGPPERRCIVNWNSPTQVLEIFKGIGLPLESVAEQHIIAYKSTPLVKQYLTYKEVQTLVSKFGMDYLKHVKNGRIHCDIWPILDTYRVAMKEPNISQIPQDNGVRNCFLPDEGYVFIDSDYASQELALIAADSKDPTWLEIIENNWDLHSVTAQMVYKDKWEEEQSPTCAYYHEVYVDSKESTYLTKEEYDPEVHTDFTLIGPKQKCNCKQHKKMRTNIKTVNYGIAYGIGPQKLSSVLECTKEEAKTTIDMYNRTFVTLSKYFENLRRYGKTYMKMKSFEPFNATRYFNEHGGDFKQISEIERQSMNTRIQMTGATILKYALYKIYNQIQLLPYPVRIVMPIHDAIITQTLPEHAEHWSNLQTTLMREASDRVVPNVKIGVATKITDKWEK